MDKRLGLTDQQKALVKKLEILLKELDKEKIGIIADQYDYPLESLMFYNKSEVKTAVTYEHQVHAIEDYGQYRTENGKEATGKDEIWYTPDPKDLLRLPVNIDQHYFNDQWFSVLLERNDEVNTILREKEKAAQLASMEKKQKELQKDIKRYEEAVSDGSAIISRLEKKDVAKEIIKEERINIEDNKEQIEILQKELSNFNEEIKDLENIFEEES